MSGEELKKLFCEKNNINSNEFNIRMFFAGNEISNNHYLYQYNIKNEYKIQVMRVQKPKEDSNKKEVEKGKVKKEKKKEVKNEKESEEEDDEVINNNVGVEKAEDVENEN